MEYTSLDTQLSDDLELFGANAVLHRGDANPSSPGNISRNCTVLGRDTARGPCFPHRSPVPSCIQIGAPSAPLIDFSDDMDEADLHPILIEK